MIYTVLYVTITVQYAFALVNFCNLSNHSRNQKIHFPLAFLQSEMLFTSITSALLSILCIFCTTSIFTLTCCNKRKRKRRKRRGKKPKKPIIQKRPNARLHATAEKKTAFPQRETTNHAVTTTKKEDERIRRISTNTSKENPAAEERHLNTEDPTQYEPDEVPDEDESQQEDDEDYLGDDTISEVADRVMPEVEFTEQFYTRLKEERGNGN